MSLRHAVVLFAVAALPAAAQAPHRELGTHEHGRGTLNIAVEGDKVTMELETPGMDLVGFEHAAKTKREELAVEKARAQLSAPLTLFALPPAADCHVSEINVSLARGGHDDVKQEHGQEPGQESRQKSGRVGENEANKAEEHSAFHAEYAFVCAVTRAIDGIQFGYFQVFAGAEKLEVNLITPKGQTKFEATREKPNVSLAGMM
jgi:hypothetical protein